MTSGERIGECVALLVEDINLEEHYILIRRTETQADNTEKQIETVREGAKTQAGIRRVAIPDNALEWLREIKEIAEKTGGGYLFKLTENVYIKDRNRMKEKSRILGEIDELRLDPLEEENPNCRDISFFDESPMSHPALPKNMKPEKAFK